MKLRKRNGRPEPETRNEAPEAEPETGTETVRLK